MANEAEKVFGTEVVMESAGSSISDGGFAACADADFLTAQVGGYPLGRFELDIPGFSTAPTAGAVVNLYERKFNSDGNAAPTPDATYKNDYIGTFVVDVADAAQYLSIDAPINYYGADYYLEWIDGGAGSASTDANWVLRVTPWTLAPGS
jgi:hypothetical protein